MTHPMHDLPVTVLVAAALVAAALLSTAPDGRAQDPADPHAPPPPQAVIGIHRADALRQDVRALDGELDGEPGTRTEALAMISAFASRFMRPKLRRTEEITSLGDTTLVALARPAQHAWLRHFIELNRGIDRQLVEVQCRFVHMTPHAHRRLVAPLLAARVPWYQHVVLQDSDKTTRYLAGLAKFRGVDIVQAPRLLSFAAQRCQIAITDQTSYVKDFHPTFDATGRLKGVDPIIDVVRAGVSLECTAAMVRADTLGMSLYASLSELQKPIKSIVLQFKGQPGALEVQKPELEVAEVRADVEIPDGSTVLFELPRKADRHLIVLITARRQIADPPDPADHKDR